MKHLLFTLACLAITPAKLPAEIADSSAAGFTVKVAAVIHAAPAEVYRRMLRVSEWWNPEHTWSGDSRNLSIEERAGGCFCERLPGGGGVRHMEVVNFAPGKSMVLTGGLGPLQSIAATGAMNISLSAERAETRLSLTYTVAGYLPAGMNTWAAPVDGVLSEQVTRLKNYVEKGAPAPQ